ncbi:MAG: hypothetical protein HQK99_00735 [Nitrospirae bacterium]|nr:hypothetical protein [Nitrospirota bacterium]
MDHITIPFQEIVSNYGGALIDISSLSEMSKHGSSIVSNLNNGLMQLFLSEAQSDKYGLPTIPPILERFIVHDFLVCDIVALDSIQGMAIAVKYRREKPKERFNKKDYNSLSGYSNLLLNREESKNSKNVNFIIELANKLPLKFTYIPNELYNYCDKLIRNTSNSIKNIDVNTPWNNYGFGGEKSYQDNRSNFLDCDNHICRSNLGVERTIFYYEIAAAARVPIVLHPARNVEMMNINRAIIDAYKTIKQRLKEKFENPINHLFSNINIDISLQYPALSMYMLKLSAKRGQSLLQTVLEIRETKEAKAFRNWLKNIQYGLVDDSYKEKFNALKLLNEIDKITKVWIDELNTSAGISYKPRSITLSKLPRIGLISSLLDDISFPDPILVNTKSYLTFISQWYA